MNLNPARLATIPTDQVLSGISTFFSRGIRSPYLTGFLTGLIAISQFAILVSLIGTSSCMVVAYGIALLLGVGLASHPSTRASVTTSKMVLIATACLGPFVSPWLSMWAFVAPFVIIPSLIGLALLPSAWAATRLMMSSRGIDPKFLAGCSAGLAYCFFLDPVTTGLIGTSLLAACLFAISTWMTRNEQSSDSEVISSSIPHLSMVFLPLCSGFAAAIAIRYVAQLMLPSGWVIAFELSTFCGWVSIASIWTRSESRRSVTILVSGLMLVGSLILFPQLIEASMAFNAYLSWTMVLIAARAAIIALLMAPAGFLFACSLGGLKSLTFSLHSFPARFGMLLFGFLLAKIGIIPTLGMNGAAVCLVVAMAALAVWSIRRADLIQLPRLRRRALIITATSFAAMTFYTAFSQPYQPSLASRCLFSTAAFNAYRYGQPVSRIAVMQDTRTAHAAETPSGSLSAEFVHGSQWQIRKNGLPSGAISTMPLVTPQSPAEIVSTVLPLLLHDSPRNVQVLGAQSGSQIRVALSFPVTSLNVVEANSTLVSWLKDLSTSTPSGLNLDDPRLTLQVRDPLLENVTGKNGLFDLILCNPEHSSTFDAAGTVTAEFYHHASRRLAPNGMFAQRFQIADYGSKMITAQLATFRSVFPHVSCFEVSPGEMLLLGTHSQTGFLRDDLLDRASRTHVQNLMAEIGWDSSILFNLAYVTNDGETAEAFDKAIAKSRINTAANGFALEKFPRELVRWGNKRQEIQQDFAESSQHLIRHLELLAEDPNNTRLSEQLDDLKKRLTDIHKREQLVSMHPDEPWLYRTEIKTQLTEHPRTQIVPVKGEGLKRVVHLNDQRRIEYFEALSRCLNESSKSEEAYLELKSYLLPFDPLISEFIHPELARICQQRGDGYAYQELLHRLHAITFSTRADRSVRDIHRCLELLSTGEIAELSNAQKFDLTNSLLETLKFRWDLRASQEPLKENILLNDISASLDSISTALALLEKTSIDPMLSQSRCDYITSELVAPLSEYRSDLLTKKSKMALPTP